MNVKQLKELLADAPEDAPVLGCGSDHSHYLADVEVGEAAESRTRYGHSYSEYFDDECLEEGEKKIPAVIIR